MRLSFYYLVRMNGGDSRLRQLRRDTRRWKPGDMMTVKIQLTGLIRGLKDPEGAKRRMESKAAAAAAVEGNSEGNMKWQVG